MSGFSETMLSQPGRTALINVLPPFPNGCELQDSLVKPKLSLPLSIVEFSSMKNPCFWLAAASVAWSCDAAPIAQESFDYTSPSALSTRNGGTGWGDGWYHEGASTVVGAAGLGFTDSLGNVLNTTGLAADTSGTTTTRSFRVLTSGLRNNVWISVLYQLPASNNKFEGVSFYRGTQQAFSINNPGTATNAGIHLTNNLNNAAANTQRGTFGVAHLIVLKLTKAGGAGGLDRVEAYIDPILSVNPSSPVATIDGTDFNFDRVRLAGQDGASLLVDELRVGENFADVTPHIDAPDDDADNDGLTDAQEAVLGLDPAVSDAALVAGIQAHPDWFDLYTASEMLGLGNGGVILPQSSNGPVNFVFEVQDSEDLTQWGTLETYSREVDLPSGKNYLRVTLQDR
jgi:hypothetical protein